MGGEKEGLVGEEGSDMVMVGEVDGDGWPSSLTAITTKEERSPFVQSSTIANSIYCVS
jgi:hypothetical protein